MLIWPIPATLSTRGAEGCVLEANCWATIPAQGLTDLTSDLTTFLGLSVRDCRTIPTRGRGSNFRSRKPAAPTKGSTRHPFFF